MHFAHAKGTTVNDTRMQQKGIYCH